MNALVRCFVGGDKIKIIREGGGNDFFTIEVVTERPGLLGKMFQYGVENS